MRISIFFILFLLVGLTDVLTQLNPTDAGYVYYDDTVARIDILIDADSLELLLEDNTDKEYAATFIFTKSETEIDTIDLVGFRVRGNVSRILPKKSFKISMNSFIQGQKFYGLEKLNLKETYDCAQVRSRTCWTMVREMGIPYLYVSFVRLYINNEYRGLYTNVEHIDEVYTKKRFGNNNGNLYKCRAPSELYWFGEDQDLYKQTETYYIDRVIRHYELKTNIEEDDYSDLVHFIDVLNNTDSSEFKNEIEQVLNVDNVLKFFVLEVYLGHWDSYSMGGNNYYLYHNQETDKFEYITYDLDLTLGVDLGHSDLHQEDIYQWGSGFPLRAKLLEVDEYRNNYTFYLKQLVERFPLDTVRGIAEELQEQIRPFLFDDPYYSFTEDEFNNSLDNPYGIDIYGMMNYLALRRESILQTLDATNTYPIITAVDHNKPGFSDTIQISCMVSDEITPRDVVLYYQFNENGYSEAAFGGEAHQSPGYTWNYTADIPSYNTEGRFDYYIEATDEEGQTSREPRGGYYSLHFVETPELLRISEVMACNNYSITDEHGDRDDWIEIFNAGSDPVSLSNKYLSDSYTNPNEWQMPGIVLEPGEHVFFWADNEKAQGDKHASFRLSRNGETVYMFEKLNGEYLLVDSMAYPELEANQSFGLNSDGSGGLTFLEEITPGYANNTNGLSFLVLSVDMSIQRALGNFTEESTVDVVGDFNDWEGSDLFGDSNGDDTYRQTIYGLDPGEEIQFRFRIDQNNDNIEFSNLPGENGHRNYTLIEGVNNLSFYFNDDTQELAVIDIQSELVVYPNPFKDILYIRSDLPIVRIEIYNMLGQQVHSEKVGLTSGTVNLGNLNPGQYILKATFDGGTSSIKVLRQ